jgi:hypothetical protein
LQAFLLVDLLLALEDRVVEVVLKLFIGEVDTVRAGREGGRERSLERERQRGGGRAREGDREALRARE